MQAPGACIWKIALKYKVKKAKTVNLLPSNYKASPIDFET